MLSRAFKIVLLVLFFLLSISLRVLLWVFFLPGKILWPSPAAPAPHDYIAEIADDDLRDLLQGLGADSRYYLNANPHILDVLCQYNEEMISLYEHYADWCASEGLDGEIDPEDMLLMALTDQQRKAVSGIVDISRGITRRTEAVLADLSEFMLA